MSQVFEVTGGNRLSGTIQPQGAKNEVLQIICAALLTPEKVTINNVPNIVDVNRLLDLVKGLGAEVIKTAPNTFTIEAKDIDLEYFASKEYQQNAKRIRGSVMLLGVLLGRCKKAFLPKPGGDKIGRRRLDTHFHGFTKLGATFKYDDQSDVYYLEGSKLKGGYILMDEISVTGTANLVMAASLAHGKTEIFNAACEPYLQQLCKMLVRMGAKIEGLGSNRLLIEGVTQLSGTEHNVMPDMIEIGSFMGLAAMTKSSLTIANAYKADLGRIPDVFAQVGILSERIGDDMFIPAQESYEIQKFIDGSILTVYDAPWPGFSPDLMSILLVASTQSKGSVLIHQKMFESRLFFVDKLIDMGAQIILCDPHRATVIGMDNKSKLRGIRMSSPDIRAGVSLLIAALSAEGTSVISNINQIDRGYENIDGRLQALGANIKRLDA